MAQAFTAVHEFDHPAEEVWAQLTDWDHAAGWLGVESMRAEGPTAVGTTLVFRTRGKERHSEIADLRPGRSITLRSRQGGVTADYAYTVEPAGTGSRATLAVDVRVTGIWLPLGPVIRGAIRKQDSGQLDRLAKAIAAR